MIDPRRLGWAIRKKSAHEVFNALLALWAAEGEVVAQREFVRRSGLDVGEAADVL